MDDIKSDKFLKIVDLAPLVSIDLIIRNDTGQILLGYRSNNPAKGCWFVPGGIVKKNESLARAFGRISKKEIGINLNRDASNFLGVFEHFYPDNFLEWDNINTHYIVLAHEIRVADGVRILRDDQHSEIKWWSVSGLLGDPAVHENTKVYFNER